DGGGQSDKAAGDSVERAIERATELTNAVRDAAIALNDQKLPRLFEGGMPFGVFFALWFVAAIHCVVLLWPYNLLLGAASLLIAAVATGGVYVWLRPVVRGQSVRQFQKIQQLLADARHGLRVALEAARERGQREAQELVAKRDRQISDAEDR